jgi:hypothetical protein
MNNKKILESHRLTLIASTLAHLRTELESPEQLSRLFNAVVSPAWPTGEYDRDAMEFFRARLEEGGAAVEGWYGWYAVRAADQEGPRALVGGAGYYHRAHHRSESSIHRSSPALRFSSSGSRSGDRHIAL